MAQIGPLAHQYLRVVPQPWNQLLAPDVDSNDFTGATVQAHISKTAGGRSSIEDPLSSKVHPFWFELLKRAQQFIRAT